jgi:uncharacterized membrane protein YecN with MAPEG domain
MAVPVTALYAGLLGVLFATLAVMVGRERSRTGISIGDGGNEELLEAIRRHANLAEFLPLMLVLMLVAEINGAPRWWLHLLGAALVVARVLHAFGIKARQMMLPARVAGAGATMIVLLALCGTVIWQALRL